MKKNLILFTLLIVLLSVAYLFEEKYKTSEHNQRDESARLLSLTQENFIALNIEDINFDFKKLEIDPYSVKFNEDLLTQILIKLNSIKIISKLNSSDIESEHFKENIMIKIYLDDSSEKILTLGKMNPISGHFYLSLKNREGVSYYLAWIDQSFNKIYKTEEEKSQMIYSEFKSFFKNLLSLSLEDILYQKLLVSNNVYYFENKNLVYSFVDQKPSFPELPKELKYNDTSFKTFLDYFKTIKVVSSYKKEKPLVSNIYFKLDNDIIYFQPSKSSVTFFIESIPELLFVSNNKSFLNLDFTSFIDKRISFSEEELKVKDLPFSLQFIGEDNTENFILESFTTFKIKSLNHKKINEKFFNMLFNFLFSSIPEVQPTLIEVSDVMINDDNVLKLEVFNRAFYFHFLQNSITIIDKENKIKLKYNYDLKEYVPSTSKDFYEAP